MRKRLLSIRYKNNGKSASPLDVNQKIAKLNLMLDIEKGILQWEKVQCRCGSNMDLTLTMKERRGIELTTVICKNCGLIRTNPRFSKTSNEIFYQKHYRNLFAQSIKNEKEIIIETFKNEFEKGKYFIEYINKNLYFKNGLVFDFGAGTGGSLKAFKENGYETFGVDLNEIFLKYGLTQNLNLKKGSSEELKNYPKKRT